MTTTEQYRALENLAPDIHLRIAATGKWFCSTPGLEVAANGLLISYAAYGDTAEEAIANAWKKFTNGVTLAQSRLGNRTYWKWIGYMWQQVEQPKFTPTLAECTNHRQP